MIAGGATSTNYTAVVDIFDVNTMQWSKASLSQARANLAAASAATKLIFAGGSTYASLQHMFLADVLAERQVLLPLLISLTVKPIRGVLQV